MSQRVFLFFAIFSFSSFGFLSGCGGGSSYAKLPISVTVSPLSSSTLQAGATVSVSAQVMNDSANMGVAWTVSCTTAPCGSISPTTTASGASTTYTAPGSSPPSPVTVTITATSVADYTKSNSVTLNLQATKLPISVTVSPLSSSTLQAGATVSVSAQVMNDSANMGVTWTVSCATAPCGSISPTTTASGASTTYTAPATAPPSPVTVTITATSVADSTKSASVMLTLVTGIVVNLSPSVNPVAAGGTALISAMVMNDPANKGVNPNSWSISPAIGAGTLSNPTSTSVTYTAPATPPPSDVQLTISATAASDSTVTGSAALTFAAIAVSLSAAPSSIEATGTSTITATVSYDPANGGVDPASWAIVGSNGTLSGRTNSSVTYTAPSTPPADDATVMIVASAASDSTRTANTTLTVLAITIQLEPGSALIPINHGSQQFTATTQNDPAAPSQVNWGVTQSGATCTSGCGTVSPSTTASGSPTIYKAPSTMPANSPVLLTAASATDPTKVTDASITLTNGVVQVVPTNLNFGIVKVNQPRVSTVSLTNTGATALTINGVSVTGSNAEDFSTANNCGSSLAAGASCQITTTFRPKGAGTFYGTLNINDSSSDSPQQVSMVGRGRNSQFEANHAAVNSALSANTAPSVPPPTGPDKVGTRLLDLVDSRRTDPFLTNGANRELLVRLWYPAADAESCPRAEYTSAMVWRDFSQLVGLKLPQVTTNSCWNLPMVAGSHPVVIFTPGYTGTFTDYTFLFEDLASRGYVVASVDHTFEATAVEFPDGRFVQSVFGSHLGTGTRSDEASMAFAVYVRLSDLEFVTNELEILNAGADAQLAGKLDMTRVALAGHSLGGLTTILAIERDARFRAGITLDGAVPNAAFLDTETPVLLVAAGRDTWTEEEVRLWNSLRGPRLAVNLRGAEHVTPSDLIWLAPGAVETGTMGPQKTIAALRNYIAAFLDVNLSDKTPDSSLTRPSAEYPDAVVTLRNQTLHAKPN